MGNGRPLDWINIIFLVSTPLAAVFGTAFYVYHNGIHWLEITSFFLLFALSGLGVTGGYHRYYSHRSHHCHPIIQIFYLFWGAAAVENAVLDWASDHRYHHKFVDQEEDPYNILKGGLWAHILWIFFKDTRGPARFDNAPDLVRDPLVQWQKKNYLSIVAFTMFLLPLLIGMTVGRPIGGLLWGGILRVVTLHHMTFFVNSWCHMFGSRPYSLDNTARDHWILAFVTNGEGYHNFHHKFPSDYRNGTMWYHWDPTKWLLWSLEKSGLTRHLNRTSKFSILRARLEVEAKTAEKNIRAISENAWERVRDEFNARQKQLTQRLSDYMEAQARFIEMKKTASSESLAQWRSQMRQNQRDFKAAWNQWRRELRALSQPAIAA